ncbi:ParA family protein [Nitrosomonas sp.]|uniref:ParA family protein n=1 Tax=Nitrosomonas sp. TaxID=42353 RepID=UPI001D6C4E38|nr:AAA family ATPase [Nitrosomonas sp.]MCB1950308.1 AAA family ATPase [Nitrosomonas sp.]MCP5244364.1 AAA family ATPase [Burkholderiales bacterium]MDR4514933.1 AAA family ATPase [Nitrosomonas sp.]
MKIVACYNIKGGIGKTAAAVNLAYLAAHEGARTLVWDLDPQGAASFYFRIKPKVKKGSKGLLTGKKTLEDAIKGTDYSNLDLIPADFSYRNLDLQLDEIKKSDTRIRKLLKPLAGDYDFIFLDCPPSISLVSENTLIAADAVIVPTIPTTLSLRTLDQIVDFCKKLDIDHAKIITFFSMADSRKKLHKQIVENPPQHVRVLNTSIPYASDVERMGVYRQPVPVFAGNSRAAKAYQALWKEIKTILT